jgi:hypothetical protein
MTRLVRRLADSDNVQMATPQGHEAMVARPARAWIGLGWAALAR